MKDIKRMKLYHNPQRIYNELDACEYNSVDRIKVQDLASFDQYHYLGTDSVEDAIKSLKINDDNTVLEIGSGIGGPARYLADKTGCNVTALELQSELHEVACGLTEKCELSHLVKHVHGDILDFNLGKNTDFDFVVSWLAFLHIPDRETLLNKCYNLLKPNGEMFIEDFYKIKEFKKEEIKVLSNDIACEYLPNLAEYKKQLIESGFKKIKLFDKTDSWKTFVKERKEKFIQTRESQIKIHDKITVDELEDFFSKMSWLFEGGNLGGLRIIAKK